MLVKIQFAIIAGIFDYNPKVSVAMKSEYWEKCMPAVEKVSFCLMEYNLLNSEFYKSTHPTSGSGHVARGHRCH